MELNEMKMNTAVGTNALAALGARASMDDVVEIQKLKHDLSTVVGLCDDALKKIEEKENARTKAAGG